MAFSVHVYCFSCPVRPYGCWPVQAVRRFRKTRRPADKPATTPPVENAAPADKPDVLPPVEIAAPRRGPPTRRPKARVATSVRNRSPNVPPPTEAQAVNARNDSFDGARRSIVAATGASQTEFSHQAIEALPQGTNAPLDKVLLQAPGVSQDSAASGDLHVRNEHANMQYRINGIMLPDGVGAFGQILDTGSSAALR